MKVEVGRTYKDRSGTEWLVEVKLTRPHYKGYPFLATDKDGRCAYYDEEGNCSYVTLNYTLLPNIKTVERWFILNNPAACGFGSFAEARDALNASLLRRNGWSQTSPSMIVKTTFEVEE